MVGTALLLVTAHVADVVYRGAHPLVATLITVCATVVAAVATFVYVYGGTTLRVLVAGSIGLAALAVGAAFSGVHSVIAGVHGGDATGLLLAPAGMVLAGLAIRTGLAGRRRRWWLVLVPVGFVFVQWVVLPIGTAGLVTAAPHPNIPSATSLGIRGARSVTFPARDGIPLAGWYVPGHNRAAVMVMHGSHGTRNDAVEHLRVLHRAGYAVLAFDARGHGQSTGQTNALGWNSDPDVAGAVRFLRRQAGVDPRRIGALGLSMGAEEALRAAADGIPLRAVVADGAGASTMGDQELVHHGTTEPIFRSVTWLAMRATEVASGEAEPPPLAGIIGRIRTPVLLIASSAPGERAIDAVYRRRIGANARLWYVRDAGHTRGLGTHRTTYAARVLGFLRSSLGPPFITSAPEVGR